MASQGLSKKWAQLTQEREILSEGCNWGSGLQKRERGGQGNARDWSRRKKGLMQEVMWPGPDKGQ